MGKKIWGCLKEATIVDGLCTTEVLIQGLARLEREGTKLRNCGLRYVWTTRHEERACKTNFFPKALLWEAAKQKGKEKILL